MEGGFCKALLMKKADGTEVVAKLPSRMAGPPKYSTASEVATLKCGKINYLPTYIPLKNRLLESATIANMFHVHGSTGAYQNTRSQDPNMEL